MRPWVFKVVFLRVGRAPHRTRKPIQTYYTSVFDEIAKSALRLGFVTHKAQSSNDHNQVYSNTKQAANLSDELINPLVNLLID